MDFLIEHDADGRILRTGFQQSNLEAETFAVAGGTVRLFPMADVSAAYAAALTGDYYFEAATESLVRRPVLFEDASRQIIANGIDETFLDLPDGSKVLVDDQEMVVAGGEGLFLTTDTPGTLVVFIEPPFPYQPITMEIIAHAP